MPASHENHQPSPIIALVEDEAILREEMAFQLRHKGFRVATFPSAREFYRELAVDQNMIAVLDILLEGEDGLSMCQHLRAHNPDMGIIFVTARDHREHRLEGLAAGADAYLVKPVDIDELELVLRRLVQRSSVVTPAESAPLPSATGWQLDAGTMRLSSPNGVLINLTLNEVRILGTLMHHAGTTCTATELGIALGLLPEELDRHRIEVILSRLRSKVQRLSGMRLPLYTERANGYRLAN